MPSHANKEIESVTLLKNIKTSKKELRNAMKRLRIHFGLHKKYYSDLLDVELILTRLQNDVEDRVDGIHVQEDGDPEATVNFTSPSGQKPEEEN